MERYNKERVILETEEGTAHSDEQLIEVWMSRIKEHFPHYHLKSVKFMENKGKEKI